MFDILAGLDEKFSKVCEREYDGISQELKKWFKKLTVCVQPAMVTDCCACSLLVEHI